MQGVAQNARVTREEQARLAAAELIVFADGAEEAGMIRYAQRARSVARDTLWLVDELAAERSARQALQTARDRLEQIVLSERPVSSRSAGQPGVFRGRNASPAEPAVSASTGKIVGATKHRRRHAS